MPLLLRYPPRARAGTQVSQFALGIDLAPTLLELAGEDPDARREFWRWYVSDAFPAAYAVSG